MESRTIAFPVDGQPCTIDLEFAPFVAVRSWSMDHGRPRARRTKKDPAVFLARYLFQLIDAKFDINSIGQWIAYRDGNGHNCTRANMYIGHRKPTFGSLKGRLSMQTSDLPKGHRCSTYFDGQHYSFGSYATLAAARWARRCVFGWYHGAIPERYVGIETPLNAARVEAKARAAYVKHFG